MELPPEGLIPRLLSQEIAYTAQRAAVIANQPGNPYGAAWRSFGTVFACQVRGVPSPWLNRAIGLGEATADQVPAIAAWFAEAGMPCRFETTPDTAGPKLARALAATGALPIESDAIVWGTGHAGAMPEHVAIATDVEAVEMFLDTHLEGLGIPDAVHPLAKANMRGWQGQPGLVLLVANDGAAPTGSCVLYRGPGLTYIADMATVPAHRGRGIQARLLAAAHALHGESGVVWARCRFLSQSHRNLQRAGLRTLCTTTFWS